MASQPVVAPAPANGSASDKRWKQGYQRLGEYMAWVQSQAMFSRFRSANMITLLLLQAEVAELEEQFTDAVLEDNSSNDAEKQGYSSDWSALKKSGPGTKQWLKAVELKNKLAEYSEQHPDRIGIMLLLI
jgi:hypothetical protein